MAGIPQRLLEQLRREAGSRCGYCQTSSHITGQALTVEHIIPVALGGTDAIDNLWLSCRRCNQYKAAQMESVDPETGQSVTLFNPRTQAWGDHFVWSADGTRIVGLIPAGRATIAALQMNHDDIVGARLLWVSVGWHPPRERY